ncbi:MULTISPECIES: hypothetical protein [unclassified Polaribacter]|uniref:hypothetical protein n=1 Tax=unclassified Polaribacter TaxID=196858 RepID=UPI0016753A6A|nr:MULTISPECIES: hypothetical protein [unclassified Polaribacter]
MKKEQTLLLRSLAKKLKKEIISRELAIESLSSAGIVAKNGKMTKYFPNLERVLSVTK